MLESRCAPAIFAGAGPTLTITLNNTGETVQLLSSGSTYSVQSNFEVVEAPGDPTGGNITGFGTTTVTIQAGAYTAITINNTASGTAVIFADSGSNPYTASVNVSLSADAGVSFLGASNFAAGGLTVSSAGPVTVQPGATLVVAGTAGLSLTSTADAINSSGAIVTDVGGAVTFATQGGPLSLGGLNAASLTASAAGFITQATTGPAITSAEATFTVSGNYGISLTNPANAIGIASLNNPDANVGSGSAVQLVTAGNATLGNCNLGLGALSVQSVLGNILELGTITQAEGAQGATFINNVGALIDLGFANSFSGPLDFVGPLVTNLILRNASPQAVAPSQPALPGTPASLNLTLVFDNAPAVLPALQLASLHVTAQGISMVNNTTYLNIAGDASFDSGNLGIDLNDADFSIGQGNQFGLLELTSTGLPSVGAFAVGNLTLGNISVGPSRLQIISNGMISQAPGTDVTHDGLTTVIYGELGLDLSNPGNMIPGVLNLQYPGSTDFLSIVPPGSSGTTNPIPPFVRGDVTINLASGVHINVLETTGNFSITATGKVQAEELQIMGSTTITAPDIEVSGPDNDFGGPVKLIGNSTDSTVTVIAQSGILLDTTTAAVLSVTANAGSPPPAGFTQGDIQMQPDATITITGKNSASATFDAGSFAVNADLTLDPKASVTPTVSLTAGATSGLAVHSAPVQLADVTMRAGDLDLSDDGDGTKNGDITLVGKVLLSDAGQLLSITAEGSITEATGGSISAGAGSVKLTANGKGEMVSLDQPDNQLNDLAVVAPDIMDNVTVLSESGFILDDGSNVTGNLTLTAHGDGTIVLPNNPLTLQSLTVDAGATKVRQDIKTKNGDVIFQGGPVTFSNASQTAITVDSAGNIDFADGLSTQVDLSFNVGTASDMVTLNTGKWDQGTNKLTVSGELVIGDGTSPAVFQAVAGASLTVNQTQSTTTGLSVAANGEFQVLPGTGSTAVRLENNASQVEFEAGSRFGIDLGGTVELDVVGTGSVVLDNTAGLMPTLFGSGLASTTAVRLLKAPAIKGTFTGGAGTAFLAESDAVTATYSPTDLTIQAVLASASNTVMGMLNGVPYTVASSSPTNEGLVVLADAATHSLAVVVRSDGGTGSSTLTISSTTLINLSGLAVYGTAALTVTAVTSNLTGDVLIQETGTGGLAALMVNDAIAASGSPWPILIEAGNAAGPATAILGQIFQGVQVQLTGALQSLQLGTLVAGPGTDGAPAAISAAQIGMVTISGDLDAALSNTIIPLSGFAVDTVSVGGTLSGTWQVQGDVNQVTAGNLSGASLSVTGQLVTLNATQGIGITKKSTLNVGSFGTIMVGSGGIQDSILTATTTGSSTTTFNVQGAIANSTLRIGDPGSNNQVQSISINQGVTSSTLLVGFVTTLQIANGWSGSTLSADSLGNATFGGGIAAGSNITVTGAGIAAGNPAVADLTVLGDFAATSFEVSNGDLANVSVAGNLSVPTIKVDTGNIGQFDVAGQTTGTQILLGRTGNVTTFNFLGGVGAGTVISVPGDPGPSTNGNIVSLTASSWTDAELDVQSVGTFTVTGSVMSDTTGQIKISAATNSGLATGPIAFGSFNVGGNLENVDLTARNGIGTLFVGGAISNVNVTVNNNSKNLFQVGEIQQMTVGSITGSTFNLNKLGTGQVNGDVTSTTILTEGGSGNDQNGQLGVVSLHVTGDWTQSSLIGELGAGYVTIDGAVTDSSFSFQDSRPPNTALQNLTVGGSWIDSTLFATNVSTFQVKGDFVGDGSLSSQLTVSATVTTFAVSGNLVGSVLDVAGPVGALLVGGRVDQSQLALAYTTTTGVLDPSVGTLQVGSWTNSGLTTWAVGQWIVAGDMSSSPHINFLGQFAPGTPALQQFSAGGAVTDTIFQIAAGDVAAFIVCSFTNSSLLVGFRPPQPLDITAPPTAESFSGAYTLGLFQTTGQGDGMGASFANSNVVAALLGQVSLASVAPSVGSPTLYYGIAFWQSAGPGGPILVGGMPESPGFRLGQFAYAGLVVVRPSAPGVFRQGVWVLNADDTDSYSGADPTFIYGLPTDVPVTGDWTGSGATEVGVFRQGLWVLNSTGTDIYNPGDLSFIFGAPGDIPVTGDWLGNGVTNVGVVRVVNGALEWILDINGTHQYAPNDPVFIFGAAGDIPVTGMFNYPGSPAFGKTDIGIFRHGLWVLDQNQAFAYQPGVDLVFIYGYTTDTPITGDWNGDGITDVGVVRATNGTAEWVLNTTGTRSYSAFDAVFIYGIDTDHPVSGAWAAPGATAVLRAQYRTALALPAVGDLDATLAAALVSWSRSHGSIVLGPARS